MRLECRDCGSLLVDDRCPNGCDCPECGGAGEIEVNTGRSPSDFRMEVCEDCNGARFAKIREKIKALEGEL